MVSPPSDYIENTPACFIQHQYCHVLDQERPWFDLDPPLMIGPDRSMSQSAA